jgi:hypothetical protein
VKNGFPFFTAFLYAWQLAKSMRRSFELSALGLGLVSRFSAAVMWLCLRANKWGLLAASC